MMTLREILNKKSNDFSKLEKEFRDRTCQDILSQNNFEYSELSAGITIVIPTYNANDTLPLTLSSIVNDIGDLPKHLIDVLVIDDASDIPAFKIVDQYKDIIRIDYYRHNRNLGLGPTRREAVELAKQKNIIFLDADVIITNHFIKNQLVAYNVLPDKAMFVSLQETTERTDKRIVNYLKLKLTDVNIFKKDFRSYVKVKKIWDPPRKEIGKVYRLLETTNYFKDFGFGRKIGLWTLPMMAVGLCMGAPRLSLLETGGAPSDLKGWGWNDTCLGAKAIGNGLYLIPLLNSAVMQIKHKVRLGNFKQKRKSFFYNQKVYEKMLDRKFHTHKFNINLPL